MVWMLPCLRECLAFLELKATQAVSPLSRLRKHQGRESRKMVKAKGRGDINKNTSSRHDTAAALTDSATVVAGTKLAQYWAHEYLSQVG